MTGAQYHLPVLDDPYDILETDKTCYQSRTAATLSLRTPSENIQNRFKESEKQLFPNPRRLDAPSRFIMAIRLMAHFSALKR